MPEKLWKDVEGKVKSIKGASNIEEGKFLFNKVKQAPEDAVIVEVGSFLGRTSIAMGYGCMGTHKKLYCIDVWEGKSVNFSSSYFPIWKENISIHGLDEYVIPLCGYSDIVLSQWKMLVRNVQIDFAFIDGSHKYDDVIKDFELIYSLMKMGGWIAFHDIVEGQSGCYRMWNDTVKHILSNHQNCLMIMCGQKQKKSKVK